MRKVWIAALLLAGGSAGPAPAAAQAPAIDLQPFAVRAISPQVHLLAVPEKYYGPSVSNISIIEQADGFVVVDSGQTAGNGRRVVDYIRSFSSKPVKAVAITHWHNDHPQGISAIRDAWPNVRIIATPQTKRGLQGPARDEFVDYAPTEAQYEAIAKRVAETQADFDKILADPATPADRRERVIQAKKDWQTVLDGYRGTHIILPTETFSKERLISDAQVPVRLLYLGKANTDGDAIVWLPRQRIVMSGDVVVSPIPFGFGSYPKEWAQTLAKLKALGFTTLIPGHGEPQTDAKYIDQLIGSIEDIRAQVGPLAKQGLSLAEVRMRVDFSRYADIFGKTPRLKAGFAPLWTEPMIEAAWKEAKGIPIVQGENEVKADPKVKQQKR